MVDGESRFYRRERSAVWQITLTMDKQQALVSTWMKFLMMPRKRPLSFPRPSLFWFSQFDTTDFCDWNKESNKNGI